MTEHAMLDQAPVADAPLLDIRNLSISYYSRAGEIPAVIDFSLRLDTGDAIALVGESGCGKSTVAMAIMRYLGRNGAIVGGQILFKGRDIATLPAHELRKLRGGEIAMVYQEPMSALNPSMTIGDQLMEVPIYHDNARRKVMAKIQGVLRDDAVIAQTFWRSVFVSRSTQVKNITAHVAFEHHYNKAWLA